MDIISAILSPAIAIVVTYICIQQYRTDRRRFKHELYERRLAVYKTLMETLGYILREGKISDDKIRIFFVETSESYFLFKNGISKYIDEFYTRCMMLCEKCESLKELEVGEERTKIVHDKSELLKWFRQQLSLSKKKFYKYLKV